jgi:hypothetical protein
VLPGAGTATKLSRCKEGMARVFAVRVHETGRVAVQFVSEPKNCQGTENLIAGKCACLDTTAITKLSKEQEQKQKV